MKKFTTLASIALVSAAMVATPAMAQSNVAVAPVQEASQLVQSSNVNTVADLQPFQNIQASDLNYAFADSQDLQMQQMTGQEMIETEGAVDPVTVGGIVIGSLFVGLVGGAVGCAFFSCYGK